MSAAPQVSVLMPAWNARSYVAEAVESILAQTFTDFEYLIIDDGSTDGTLAILESYALRDSRIRLTSRSNTGYLRALNEGLALAAGPLVARMDADDISLPERLAKQVEFLAQRPICLAAGTAVTWIDPGGAVLYDEHPPLDHAAINARLLQGLGGIAHPSAMFRRADVLALGAYREKCYGAEDKDLWLRLGERGELANLPETLLKYRAHLNNFTYRNYSLGMEALRIAVVEAHERRGLTCAADPLSAVPAPVNSWNRQAQWAWSAWHAGQFGTARKYAARLWSERWWSREAWVLAAYTALGPRAETLRKTYRRIMGRD